MSLKKPDQVLIVNIELLYVHFRTLFEDQNG